MKKQFGGSAIFLDRSDINTDEIIPAKYLTENSKFKLPFLPDSLKNDGNYIISLNKFSSWLGEQVEAMDEAADQKAVVLYPAREDGEYRVTRSHAELASSHQVCGTFLVSLDMLFALGFLRS